MPAKTSKPRGLAAMDAKTVRRITRAGGLATSKNKKHMAAIGRLGGLNSHRGDKKRDGSVPIEFQQTRAACADSGKSASCNR